MTLAVKTEGLAKKYVIGHRRQERYETLRDMLMHKARGLRERVRHPLSPNPEVIEQEDFWALHDINLDVELGAKLGIIGHNGAGKTTLLKLLSRITEPTEGKFTVYGRVSSLLEIGTGFHPELTGRENIFLNGAILGMTRAEIRGKFDEIVDFSEIEQFLDTPVKRYSSGMYVRLAFAVAAHLEPEILIVDEVLAVGDVQFQKKCLGQMQKVGREGRTVLFVSHNMAAIQSLCDSCVILQEGRMSEPMNPAAAIQEYNVRQEQGAGLSVADRTDRAGEGELCLTAIELLDREGRGIDAIPVGEPARIRLHYAARRDCNHVRVTIGAYDPLSIGVLRFDTTMTGSELSVREGQGVIECSTQAMAVAPGDYSLNIAIYNAGVMQDYVQRAHRIVFSVADFFQEGRFVTQEETSLMKVLVRHHWSVHPG